MRNRTMVHPFGIFLSTVLFATSAWAETIEFVTYYPSPAAAGANHAQGMAVGSGYNAVTPDNGELLVYDRLGIGTDFSVASPIFQVDNQQPGQTIAYTGYGGTLLRAINSATASNAAGEVVQFYAHDTSPVAAGVGGGIGFGGKYTGDTATVWAGILGVKENGTAGNYAGSLIFATRPQGSTWLERMRITSAGNVGIGTPTPTTKLYLYDNTNTAGTTITLHDASNAGGGTRGGVITGNWGANGLILNTLSGDYATHLYYGWVDGYVDRHHFYTNGAERVTIDPAGNVGIGTSTPVYTLHVQTGITGNWNGGFDGNTYGVWGRGTAGGLWGAATSTGFGVYGANTAYGTYGYLGYNDIGLQVYTPQANWAGIISGAYYGVYAQAASYPLFAYNSSTGYWTYLALSNYGLYTNGYIYGYWASSSEYKKNVITLSAQEEASILSRIEKMPLVHYLYKMDKDEHHPRLGVIAETVPKDVTSEDGKGLEPSAYTAYSIAGVKALAARVKRQQETIEEQRKQLQEFKERLDRLETH